ncbi:hemolysin family protein [Aliterella atlantica]|uniref:hemolysin family protein n=1 Tax=Aliterella atlantica TaxID=1827278 RepID=UPI0005D39785|nr:hemolysin family protein [Aliterella atlantica]
MFALSTNILAVNGSFPLSQSDILLRLFSVLLLIAINAFFVAAEFSLVTVRRSRIHQLVEAGDAEALAVQGLQKSIDRLLSTTQLGITLSSLALGWIGESTMGILLATWIKHLPLAAGTRNIVTHSISVPAAFLLVAYLQIVLGELCPKSLALLYPEQLARFLAPPVRAIARLFNPFIWVINQSTRWLLRLVGINYTGQGWRTPVSPAELQLIIATERESTGLEARARELLNNVFEFGDVRVAEVMVQRNNIVSLPINGTFESLLQVVTATGHSRYPVVGKSLDDVCGTIEFKELAKLLVSGKFTLSTPLKQWIRPARFVPEHTPLSELLSMMQRSHLSMVMIVDEFGGIVGLVTIQDVIAEIIGDTGEPGSSDELMIESLDENTYLVQAQLNLEDLNELLDLHLPLKNEYQTLGGFLLYQMQKIPAIGTTFKYENLEFTVVSVEGPRLHHIKLHRQA